MDFLNLSETADLEPKIFWLFLTLLVDGKVNDVKKDALLPSHLWESLTEVEKRHVAGSESKWLDRDPKVRTWRQKQQLTDS